MKVMTLLDYGLTHKRAFRLRRQALVLRTEPVPVSALRASILNARGL